MLPRLAQCVAELDVGVPLLAQARRHKRARERIAGRASLCARAGGAARAARRGARPALLC
jgi:hypothetical protein